MSILERNPTVKSCRLAKRDPQEVSCWRAEKAHGIQGSPCLSWPWPGAVGPAGLWPRPAQHHWPSLVGALAGCNKQGISKAQQHPFKVPNLASQTAAASEAVCEAYKHANTVGQIISIEQWIWFCGNKVTLNLTEI